MVGGAAATRRVGRVLLAQALSGQAVVAIYALVPLAITAVIFALVFLFTGKDSHRGSQVLGHPADLSRRERAGQSPPAPGPSSEAAAPTGSAEQPADGELSA